MREAMDQKKIVLVDISKGRIGEDASRLLGAMIITKVQLAAMSRVDIPRHERADFTLIVDEFQNFATASFASILSEARKFNLSLVVAHQYIKQLDEAVADAVFGNVGTIITFRVGADDAEFLEKEFAPEFMAVDLVNLGFRNIYLKLMIDGVTSHAFSALTMDTISKPPQSFRNEVVEYSRTMYSHPRAEVEAAISAWRAPIVQAYSAGPSAEQRAPRREAPPAPFPSEDRATGAPRKPMPSQGRAAGPRPPRRDAPSAPRPHVDRVPSPRPAAPPPPRMPQLSNAPVDFKGHPVEPQKLEEKIAQKEDVRKTHEDTGDDDLKSLIAKAFGKE